MPHNRHAGKGHFSMVSNPTLKYVLPVTMEYRGYKVGATQDKFCPNCQSVQPCDNKESWHTVNVFAFKVFKEQDQHAQANMVQYTKCNTCKNVFPRLDFERISMSQRGSFEYILLTAMVEMRMRSKSARKSLYRWTHDEATLVHEEYQKFAPPDSKIPPKHVMERGRYIERITLYRDKATTEFFPMVVAKLSDEQKQQVVKAMESVATVSKRKKNDTKKQEGEEEVDEEAQALVADGHADVISAADVKAKDRKVIEEVRILMDCVQ